MRDSDLQPRYYINAALQAMEQAYANNQDVRVGAQISRVIAALHELKGEVATSRSAHEQPQYDPHEINDFNSAI